MKTISRILILIIISFLFFTGFQCENSTIDQNSERERQNQKRDINVEGLMKKQASTAIGYSMDRYLLDQRNTRFNDPNKMMYLYVILPDGTWLRVTIIGKMASTSKRLNQTEEVHSLTSGTTGITTYREEKPDEIGTFGSSAPDKVGLTTLGSLFELFGNFYAGIYSEVPLNFTGLTKPIIDMKVEASKEEQADFVKKLQDYQKLNNENK